MTIYRCIMVTTEVANDITIHYELKKKCYFLGIPYWHTLKKYYDGVLTFKTIAEVEKYLDVEHPRVTRVVVKTLKYD